MKRIISIDGGKGGVGKSIVSTAVIDFIQHHINDTVMIIDADDTNPDVGKAYCSSNDFLCPNLDTKDGMLALADAIADTTDHYIVINCPARLGGWATHGQMLLNNLKEIDAEYCTMWVLSHQRDSVEALKNFQAKLPEICIYPVVNLYFGGPEKFDLWSGSKLRNAIHATNGNHEVYFPDIADRLTLRMKNDRLRWEDISTLSFGNKIEGQRVRATFYAAFSVLPCFQ